MAARPTQDSLDLGWSDPPLSDTPQSSEQPAVPLDQLDDDEPTRVATSATSVVVPAAHAATDDALALPAGGAALDVSAAVTDALHESDIYEEGARVTEPGLAPPPPTSAEMAAAEATLTVPEATVTAAEPAFVESRVAGTPLTAPPIVNAPPVELGSREPAGAAPTEATPPATAPQPPSAMPPASIPPPPIAPSFTPASLAPTTADWEEFVSPSLLATLKRTRPTSTWTGVGLFVAALTFAGGIGIGRSMTPPMLPPITVPAPQPASLAANSLSPTAAPAGTTVASAAPVAPSKPPAPFDSKAARAALDDAANAAKTCRATGDPKGTIPTTITFGSSGEVSNVAINSSRYAGTKTARCVSERLSRARIPEFSGFPEALKKLITVH